MYATVVQVKSDGSTETLVEKYPISQVGDLDRALAEARKLSVANDRLAFPPNVVERIVKITEE